MFGRYELIYTLHTYLVAHTFSFEDAAHGPPKQLPITNNLLPVGPREGCAESLPWLYSFFSYRLNPINAFDL